MFRNNKKKKQQQEEDFKKAVMDVMKNFASSSRPTTFFNPQDIIKKLLQGMNPPEETESGEKVFCSCPACLSYKTFENMLNIHPLPGVFDYHEMTLGGKDFKIKFWSNVSKGGNEEYMMIKEVKKFSDRTDKELQEDLEEAIASENFEEARKISDVINQKTKTN